MHSHRILQVESITKDYGTGDYSTQHLKTGLSISSTGKIMKVIRKYTFLTPAFMVRVLSKTIASVLER